MHTGAPRPPTEAVGAIVEFTVEYPPSSEEEKSDDLHLPSTVPTAVRKFFDEFSSEQMREPLRTSLGKFIGKFTSDQLRMLELFMGMTPAMRHANFAPQIPLTPSEINVIYELPCLFALIGGKLTVGLAKEFPELTTTHALFALFTGLIDLIKFKQLIEQIPDIAANLRLLCAPLGVAGLQEHLFTFEEALFANHLSPLLTLKGLHALRHGALSIQEYDGKAIPEPVETEIATVTQSATDQILNYDALVNICRFLPLRDLLALQLTARECYRAVGSDPFWSVKGHTRSKGEFFRFFSPIALLLRNTLLNFSSTRLERLASLMNMGTQERYDNLDPEKTTPLSIAEQIRIFSLNSLVAFVAGKLKIPQAKAMPDLLHPDCLLCILEDLIDPALMVSLRPRRDNLLLLCGSKGRPALREKLLAPAEALPLPFAVLMSLLDADVLEQLRTRSKTLIEIIMELAKIQPPGPDFPCLCCNRPGGQPNSHWSWLCPEAAAQQPQPLETFKHETERFKRFVAVLEEYISKGITTIRQSNLDMLLRERYVYSKEKSQFIPLMARAAFEGFLTEQIREGNPEVVLQDKPIVQFTEEINRRMPEARPRRRPIGDIM